MTRGRAPGCPATSSPSPTRHETQEEHRLRGGLRTRRQPRRARRREELAGQRATRRRRVTLALVAAAVLVVGLGTISIIELRRDTPAKQVQRGIAFSKTNSHVAAIIEFKRALQEQPDQPAVRLLLGQELSLLGDARGAEIEFEKAADAKYDLDKTLPLLVTSVLHQGRFDRVIALVNATAVESAEGNAELLAMRGSAYYALGRETEAEASWKAAQEFVPDHPATLIAQARALASKGNYDEAGRILDGISADAPQTELLTLRGDLAKASGKPNDAVAFYERALRIEPGNLFIRSNLAETLVALGRYDDASVQVKKVLGPMPDYANGHFIAALIGVGQKNLEKANEEIAKAVLLMPTDGRYQLLAGTVALQIGQVAAAEQYLTAAVTLLPDNPRCTTPADDDLCRQARGRRRPTSCSGRSSRPPRATRTSRGSRRASRFSKATR